MAQDWQLTVRQSSAKPWTAKLTSMDALSLVSFVNAFASSRRVTETTDVAFGPGPRDRLDIYAPKGAAPGSTPVVVFFYGGSFQFGDRGVYRFVGTALARMGITTVIPDYRIYPEVVFPAFVEDAARAVRWTRDTIASFGADPERLVLSGHSAGAHIAAMLTYDRTFLGAEGIDANRAIRGLVGLSGPYDFLPLKDETLKIIFGPEEGRGASQPINFVTPAAPPALLITGGGDKEVDPGNSPRLKARIDAVGGRAEVKIYPHIGHEAVVGAFSRPFRWVAPALRDTVAFVEAVTAPQEAELRKAAE